MSELMQLRNVQVIKQDKTLLHDVTASLQGGEVVGLIGPNGAGKSTLLKVLAGLDDEFTGDYQLKGKPIAQYTKKQLAHVLGYLAQEAQTHWPLATRRVIELGRLPHQGFFSRLSAADEAAIESAILAADVEHLLEQNVNTLSGGERMRILLARLFATEPEVILADEPIAALDPYHQLKIMQLLQQHAQSGGAVMVTLHDLNHAARFCDRLLLIHEGRLVGEGSMASLIEQGLIQEVYQIEIDCFDSDSGLRLFPADCLDKPLDDRP